MPVRIPVVGPDGKRGTVPAESIEAAKKQGFRVATPEENNAMKAGGENLTALSEGVGRGLTMGLTDQLGAAMDGDGGAAMKLRKQENPALAATGELGGTAAGALLPVGPVAGVAQLGRGVRAAAGGGLAGGLAAGALEGGLFGLGSVISEDGLGDHQTNVEKLAAMGGGGIFGAGLNGVTHGLGAAGSALVGKLGGSTLNGALNDLAEKALWGQIGSKSILKKRSLLGKEADVTRYALDNGMVPGLGSAEKFAGNVEAHRKLLGDEMGDVLTKASSRQVNGLTGPATQTIHGGFDSLSLGRRVENDVLAKLRKDAKVEIFQDNLKQMPKSGSEAAGDKK